MCKEADENLPPRQPKGLPPPGEKPLPPEETALKVPPHQTNLSQQPTIKADQPLEAMELSEISQSA